MRDVALLIFTTCGLLATFRSPYVGLLLWVVFSLMNPHQETYSFAHSVPWNLVIAIVTTLSWLISSEPKMPPKTLATAAVLILLAWSTFNTFFAFDPAFSWIYWNRAWKTVAMAILAGTITLSAVRFHALIWAVVASLGYYGVKGGLFTLITGGHSHVFGPKNSMIYDNNELALALVMTLPLLNYLRVNSEVRAVRLGIVGAMVLTVTSILGSYSRGGYIALTIVGIAFWLRTRNKLVYPVIAVIVLIPLLNFMPESFFQRAASIQQYSTDSSFQTRVDSWWVAYRYAMDHIPFGAGFYGMNLQGVWDKYIPGELHAVHSIYFQVLGEQGLMGFLIYVSIIGFSFLNLRAVRRDTKGVPHLIWAYELAGMLQLSLLAFCVGGAACPMDFFDLFFLWTMLSSALHAMTRRKKVQPIRALFAEELQGGPRRIAPSGGPLPQRLR